MSKMIIDMKHNKQNVEIRVTLHMKNQYGGDGQTEPTREQVREALIDFANNDLHYTEIRTAVNANEPDKRDLYYVDTDFQKFQNESNERADRVLTKQELPNGYSAGDSEAWNVHNDLVSGVMLIDGKEYTSLPLDNFGDIDAILKEQAIGRASEEQGGNRESQAKRKSYNTDRDPLNED